jgi:hypothetical protein
MRIAMLFHKDPSGPATGIDLVRLAALSSGLARLGAQVSVVAPVAREGQLVNGIAVLPLEALHEPGRFHVVKACYHFSMELVQGYDGPLVCRLVRVVDEQLPERDALQRGRLLACQETARIRGVGMVFNNRENAARWRARYGTAQRIALIPTGCRAAIPPPGQNPYDSGPPALLFLGSLAAPRMVALLNDAAERLAGEMAVHLVGKNKSGLYGSAVVPLSPLVTDHGELPEEDVWNFVRHARLGLALASGPHPFDNDLSKIATYVRGGLPVLGEERIVTMALARRYGVCQEFRYGDAAGLARQARKALSREMALPETALERLNRLRSWDRLAGILFRFLGKVVAS